MALSALHPAVLWLLLLVPAFWWVARGKAGAIHVALRCGAVAFIVIAAAQPGLLGRSGSARRIFVLDQKAQLSADERARARAILAARLARLPAGDRATVVQLGGMPVTAPAGVTVVTGAPSLSAALDQAQQAIPFGAGGTVTLITDGLTPDRRWGVAIDALLRRGIAVDTVPLATQSGTPFISAVQPETVRAGETMPVTVTVEGRGGDLRVLLQLDGVTVASTASFPIDGIRDAVLRITAPAAGFHRLRAVLVGPVGGGAAMTTLAAVQPPLRLLYLGDRDGAAIGPLQRLLGRGVAVERRDPAALPAGFDFAAYPAVMVNDLPATRLDDASQRALLRAVALDGTGVLYAGGDVAFDRGGWDRVPLAAALPVTLRHQERIEKPSVALAIVIDSSGSMGGEPLDLAKQIAVFAARKLGPQDSFGVVEFYGAKQWALPMQPVRDIAGIERTIGHMQAQGSSVLLPAIQEAYYGIKDVDARFKHILVISDGDVSEGPFEQLLRHVAGQRIAVSTAVINARDDGIARMRDWARWGRGRAYAVPDETGLVAIDFSPPQTRPEPGYRRGVIPVRDVAGHAWWGDTAAAATPPLAGYAAVAPRADAEILLMTGTGDPLLASWQYGAGRVTSLMTEPLGAGSQPWARWPGYGAWLGRTIARTARQGAPFAVGVTRRTDRLSVSVQLVSGRPAATGSAPDVTLVDDAGRTLARIAVDAEAPGLFVGTMPWPSRRDARVRVVAAGETMLAADRAGSDLAGERLSRRDALPLARLSQLTGGRVLARGSDAPTATSGGDRTYAPLWPWAALLALILYLCDITWRRWPRQRTML